MLIVSRVGFITGNSGKQTLDVPSLILKKIASC